MQVVLINMFENPVLEANKVAIDFLVCSFRTESFYLPMLDVKKSLVLDALKTADTSAVIWEDRQRHKMGGRSIMMGGRSICLLLRTVGSPLFSRHVIHLCKYIQLYPSMH
jgi:hypothetical protein